MKTHRDMLLEQKGHRPETPIRNFSIEFLLLSRLSMIGIDFWQ